jgi:hypothetical protein
VNVRFLSPSVRKEAQSAYRPLDDAIPAREAPNETDLLLCRHHCRTSRTAPVAAHAVVRALPGTSGDVAAWIGAGSLARA